MSNAYPTEAAARRAIEALLDPLQPGVRESLSRHRHEGLDPP